jgi:arabinofuranan 3-O-arabinosyltransferase
VLNTWTLQNGFLTSGLALWFLSLRERRPILAGICLGALTIKPQLGFLFPILLVIERRWTVMLVAGLTTVVMVLASIAAFGYAVWPSHALEVLPFQREVMMKLGGTFLTMMPSAFGMARLSGYESDTALAIHMAARYRSSRSRSTPSPGIGTTALPITSSRSRYS